MECPRCGFTQPDQPDCAMCGIVFAKWSPKSEADSAPGETTSDGAEASATERLVPRSARAERGEPAAPVTRSARVDESTLDKFVEALRDVWQRAPLLPGRRASNRDVRNVCEGLARLLGAGIGIHEGLQTLANSASGALRDDLRQISQRVGAGDDLAEALGEYPEYFSKADVQLVRAGERSGTLREAFDTIRDDHDRKREFVVTVLSQSTYPLLLLVMWIFMAPVPLLAAGKVDSYVMAVVTPFLVLLALWLLSRPVYMLIRDRLDLGRMARNFAWLAPWPGSIYRDYVRGIFCRTLARNLGAGIALYDSLETAASVTADPHTETAAARAAEDVGDGADLAPSLGAARIIPPGDLMIVTAGERAGELVEGLESLGKVYLERALRGFKQLAKVLSVALAFLILMYVASGILGQFLSVTRELESALGG